MNLSVLKIVFTSICIGCTTQIALHHMQSDFVYLFLKANITNLQVAVLAINTATLGIVLTKIREIIDKTGKKEEFNSVKIEMILSMKEQIALIAASLMVLAVDSAKKLPIDVYPDVLQALLIAAFVYSIRILYDTAKSVFVVLDY